ncbi:MAG TPA: hypothetical protein VEI46_08425 [Thermodesulfovibrionales bacterium]|nr:hypothetical protein [Thermodesulfovibrionales bacterium]
MLQTSIRQEPGPAGQFENPRRQGWIVVRECMRVSLGRKLGMNVENLMSRGGCFFIVAQTA